MTSWIPDVKDDDIIPSSQDIDELNTEPPLKRFRGNTNHNGNHDDDWQTWDCDTLAVKLEEQGLKDIAVIFKGNLVIHLLTHVLNKSFYFCQHVEF